MLARTNNKTLAIFSLLLTALGYAVLGANSRLLSQGFAPMTQVYVRILIGFVLSLLLFGKKIRLHRIKTAPKSDWFWLLIMGVVGYSVGVWLVTLSNLTGKLVNTAVIYATIPFVTYGYSYVLLREKIRPKLLSWLVVALIGIAIVAGKSFTPRLENFGVGELFAILAVLAAGWWSIGIKKLSSHLNNQEITSVTMLIAAISGATIALCMGERLTMQAFTLPAVWLGIAIGAVLNVVLTFFENFSFKHLNVVFGNQILMTGTLFSLVLGFLFFNETISFPEVIGAFLIVISVWQAKKLLK